jgi:hypothetical protein
MNDSSTVRRGPKVYLLHAPEVECIGRGKAHAPYGFGCKVSIATPVSAPKGGQLVVHAKALHGNPYEGHTVGPAIVSSTMPQCAVSSRLPTIMMPRSGSWSR